METVTLPLPSGRDEADALPIVEPPMHHHEFRHGRLHAKGDECRDEKAASAGEIGSVAHSLRL